MRKIEIEDYNVKIISLFFSPRAFRGSLNEHFIFYDSRGIERIGESERMNEKRNDDALKYYRMLT
jgi:hypothetical protein